MFKLKSLLLEIMLFIIWVYMINRFKALKINVSGMGFGNKVTEKEYWT